MKIVLHAKYNEWRSIKQFKMLGLLLCLTMFLSTVSLSAYADNAPTMVQTYISEKNLDMYLSTSFDESNLSVKAANQNAEILNCGPLSDGTVSVRTTILVDTSTSIPSGVRDKILEFIKYKIKNISKNEQLRIITFDDEIKTIQDFTSDRYDLDKAADNIKFDGKQSAIYDAIYNTIPPIGADDREPCFYQTIAITDGTDYTAQGITKEELFIHLQEVFYPIDIVCVSKDEPKSQNKNLSALTRIGNGRYFDIYPAADAFQLSLDLSVSDYFWIRAEIPVVLLDGSTRQIDISDGTKNISFDMKMSVVDELIEESPIPESTPFPTPSVQPPTSSAEISEDLAIQDDGSSHGILIEPTTLVIIIALLMVAVMLIVIVVLISKGKKKVSQPQPTQQTYPDYPNHGAKTDETEMINESQGKEYYSLKISNTANPNESWILNVLSDIMIGRAEGCAVRIDEISVSREQCKILVNANGLAISNLSKSNRTKLNGTSLVGEVLLHPADNIHFGRVTLRVDYIQKITDEVSGPSKQLNKPKGERTESIFG